MRLHIRLLLAIFAHALILSIAAAPVLATSLATPKELRITRITPKGQDVAAERQIVLEFNRPVVPLGRMERTAEELGITIQPETDCQWRWLNTSTLACQLDEEDALHKATHYTLTIAPKIQAEDGATIAKTLTRTFTTERPRVSGIYFKTWTAPGMPVMRAVFNQPVTAASVRDHLSMHEAGKTEQRTFTVKPDTDARKLPDFVKLPGENIFIALKDEPKSKDIADKAIDQARLYWEITPVEELPKNATINIAVEPGLVSAAGPEAGTEKRSVLTFDTFPDFAFAGVQCYDNDDQTIILKPDMSVKEKCNPLGAIALNFTTPVLRSVVKKALTITPPLNSVDKSKDSWGEADNDRDYSRLDNPHKKDRLYSVYLPMGLRADTDYTFDLDKKNLQSLQDEFGQTLSAPFSQKIATDNRKPNFELVYNNAVLEKETDSDLPFYTTNLDSFTFNYRRVTPDALTTDQTATQKLNIVHNLQFATPFGIRNLLDGQSGAMYGLVSTTPEVQKGVYGRRLFAQVTPFQAHAKIGHFNSIIWVTDMATGQPVTDAEIIIYKDILTILGMPQEILAKAKTDKNGIAILPGIEKLDPALDLMNAWDIDKPRLFVRVLKDKDMALLPIQYDFQIDSWNLAEDGLDQNTRAQYQHVQAWGMTAQGIYRAGDTMDYKIFVRNSDNLRLVSPPQGRYILTVNDPMGKKVETIDNVTLSDFGTYTGKLKIPENAAVGWYQFSLQGYFGNAKPPANENDDDTSSFTLTPMRVLVSDFTPAPFRVTSSVNGDLFKADQDITINTAARLHSGGAYGEASSRVSIQLQSRPFTSKNPKAKGFTFDSFDNETSSQQIYQSISPLNDKGERQDTVKLPKQDIVFGKMTIESAVQDDRGKYVSGYAQADYIGVDRLVGLRSPQWVYETGKPAVFSTIVVDEKGDPVAGVSGTLDIQKQITKVARVKGSGNAYLTDITTEWKKVASCAIQSRSKAYGCRYTPKSSGTYRLIASIKDTQDHTHKTQMDIWVTGSDYVQWSDSSDNALTIIPEKSEYNIGETARYLVKNPYPGAEALITVERYGVMDSFVQKLEGSTPIIEIPIKLDYAPGFYVSVVVVSPRVDKPLEIGQVDLGKPAFRIGYATTPVNDPKKSIDLTIATDKDVYRPRDTVTVTLDAKPRVKTDKPEKMELAVTVLDEAVFDLIADGKKAFDPYKGFYALDSLDVRNYNLMTRLIGRQKFEKKGANPGGDGGSDLSMRDLFKYVSHWDGTLQTDANGHAQLSFEAPDNLTGWIVLVSAVTPGDRMGLGTHTFKVNKPTELRPVMPNQVHEGDTFDAGFSIMNRTDKERTLDITLQAEGPLAQEMAKTMTQKVILKPYQRTTLYMPVATSLLPLTRDTAKENIVFTATAKDSVDSDATTISVPVHKTRVLQTVAEYGTTTENKTVQSLLIPDNIHTDTGSVEALLSPSVIANIEGAFRYGRDYPYTCWEQKLTRAVMAAQFQSLHDYLPESLTWEESATLSDTILQQASSHQAPNGGMTYFIARNEYVDPYLSAYTALAFNWLRDQGKDIPQSVEMKLQDYLANMLKKDVLPDFYSEGMSSTVRAVALAALAPQGKITRDDLIRYRAHVKNMSLFGKAHYLQAARILKEKTLAQEVTDMILAQSHQSSGKISFNETLDDGYSRILATSLRDQCAVLSALVGDKDAGDKPMQLVRAITQTRGNRDHWENTQENMFCMQALLAYAKAYESETPDMTVTALLGDENIGSATFRAHRDPTITLSHDIVEKDVGRKTSMTFEKEGTGRFYYTTRISYADKNGIKATNSGMELTREYSVERKGTWEMVTKDTSLKRGDIIRVDLFLSLPTARNFVVVNDPLPGGLEIVNRDLATASQSDSDKGDFQAAGGSLWLKYSDWHEYSMSRWSFYHREFRHDSARFYSDYLPPGRYHLSYTAQVIADGSFDAPNAKAEEMYDPDIYSLSPPSALMVRSAQ